MTSGKPKGTDFSILPSHELWILFLPTTVFIYLSIYLFILDKLPDVPEYAKMQIPMMTLLYHNNDALGKIRFSIPG